MFTRKQKPLIGGAFLFAVLLVSGSYFGSRWLHGPDVEPLPEHLLSDKPRSVSINRPVHASVSQDTPSVSEDESSSDVGSTKAPEETLSSEELAALCDEELKALAKALSALLQESSNAKGDLPEVPNGFPSDLKPVWLEDYFDENLFANHVIMYRVLIELWNQGDHGFVNGFRDGHTGKIYPLYPGVVYVTWNSYVRENPDGESIEAPYISSYLGIPSTVDPLLDSDGRIFTEEEIMSGAYVTMCPDVEFVDYNDAGYDPATILDNY